MVKKIRDIVLICVLFWLVIFFSVSVFSNDSRKGEVAFSEQVVLPTVTETPTPTPTPKIVGIPVNLKIPRLNIDAPVEVVGLDQTGKMDVPKSGGVVGWYGLGYKPGEKGGAVIAGHYDLATGAPAIFYYLDSLEVGDDIFVTDDKGIVYQFKVADKKTFSFDQVPLSEVFANGSYPGLNLITCEGIFNLSTRNYSQRTVIYSRLVE